MITVKFTKRELQRISDLCFEITKGLLLLIIPTGIQGAIIQRILFSLTLFIVSIILFMISLSVERMLEQWQ